MVKCKICGKEAENESYCVLHGKAYRSLTEKFEAWKKALEVSFEDYLRGIIKNSLTGTKVKEVAEALLSEKL